MSVWAIVPAAGSGQRFGAGSPKQYQMAAGQPLLAHVLDLLLTATGIEGLVLATAASDTRWHDCVPKNNGRKLIAVTGGATRAASVRAALSALEGMAVADDWALVHDAARPCLAPQDLSRLLVELHDDPVGGLLAAPVVDTLKRGDESGHVTATEKRDGLWRALTPQMFRYGLLSSALDGALDAGVEVTDEACAMEWAGHTPRLVSGGVDNVKVTRAEDLALAEAILSARVIKS
ncbi:MAG: 2-C-methyl-D-erythritol 4-phosphate cytidylyltransferase [Gammaproteobacteria bacterium]